MCRSESQPFRLSFLSPLFITFPQCLIILLEVHILLPATFIFISPRSFNLLSPSFLHFPFSLLLSSSLSSSFYLPFPWLISSSFSQRLSSPFLPLLFFSFPTSFTLLSPSYFQLPFLKFVHPPFSHLSSFFLPLSLKPSFPFTKIFILSAPVE